MTSHRETFTHNVVERRAGEKPRACHKNKCRELILCSTSASLKCQHVICWCGMRQMDLERRLEGSTGLGVKSCCAGIKCQKSGGQRSKWPSCSCVSAPLVRESGLYYVALRSGFTDAPSVAAVMHKHTHTHIYRGTRAQPQTTTGSEGQRRPATCVSMCVCRPHTLSCWRNISR